MKCAPPLVVAVGALLWGGCSSSTELLAIQQQLDVMQRQLATIQQQASDRGQVEELERALEAAGQQVTKSRADTEADLRVVLSRIEALMASVEENAVTLEQVSARNNELRQAIEELQVIVNRPAPTTLLVPQKPPSEIYEAATNSFERREYTAALVGFQAFLTAEPDDSNADNALYWIGECYFNLNQFEQAIREFAAVRQRYPASEMAPSALFRTAMAHLALNQQETAVAVLRTVMSDYPRSDEAVLAQRQLSSLSS